MLKPLIPAAAAAALTLAASSALAQPAPAPAARPLQFDRMPDAADFARHYPARASFEGVEGRAVVSCTVAADGALQNCSLVSDNPPAYGFGEAVLGMTGLFRVNMHTANAGLNLRLPISFRVPQGEASTPPAPPNTLVDPQWVAQPSAADLVAGAPVSREGGRAIVDCVFNAQGGLNQCHVASEDPANGGFGAAGLAMAPRYRIAPTTASGAPIAGLPVRIAMVFPRRGR